MMCSLSMAKQKYTERKMVQTHEEKVEEKAVELKKTRMAHLYTGSALLPVCAFWEGDGIRMSRLPASLCDEQGAGPLRRFAAIPGDVKKRGHY